LGRLVCPACQRDHPVPVWWVSPPEPAPVSDPGPVAATEPPASGANQPVPSAVPEWPQAAAQAGRAPAAAQGGRPRAAAAAHGRQWPRLFNALVSGRDGDGQAARAAGSAGRHAQPR
jgi:hypothetical protein